jgi:hypothetical protein
MSLVYMKRFAVFMLLYCGFPALSAAQDVKAWSMQYQLPELAAYVDLPEPADRIEEFYKTEYVEGDNSLKVWIFAIDIDVNLNPGNSGQWDTIPGKGAVWRLGIHAENALSLNLLIENYQLQKGMSLFVYDGSTAAVIGPYTAEDNRNNGIIPIQSLRTDTVIIEWNIPLQSAIQEEFLITNVGYGFRESPGYNAMIPLGVAASCNVDINCSIGSLWQREKRAVVKLETRTVKNGVSVTQHCTGSLVNQATDDKKPYLLTAHHCISTEDMAQKTVFSFNYESPSCKEAAPMVIKPITGASLLATKKELDFTLLELAEDVPVGYNPYYAGWDASGNVPEKGTGIHHPYGDVKKISVHQSVDPETGRKTPLVSGTFEDAATNLYCVPNAHWIVKRWESGITEGGSSGSPVFDQNHLIVGTLSGGTASCRNPGQDFYAKFSAQWNKYPVAEESLKQWLNPENKPVSSLGGYDPVTDFEGKCDTVSHIGYNETELLIASNVWGVLTGHNDKYWRSFAEKIENDTIVKIIGMEVSVATVFSRGSKVRFSVWKGNEFPVGNPVVSVDTVVSPEYRKRPMSVFFKETLELNGNFFIGYSIDYFPVVDTFAVLQTANRHYEGISALYVEDGGIWKSLAEDETPPVHSSLSVRAIGKFGKKEKSSHQNPYQALKIIFQSGNNKVFVYFDDPVTNVKIECFDVTGKRVAVNESGRYIVMLGETACVQVELDTGYLPCGMYLIRVSTNRESLTGKFIKL